MKKIDFEKRKKHEDLYKTTKLAYKKDDLYLLNIMLKKLTRKSKKKTQGGFSKGFRNFHFNPNSTQQFVVFKMSYSKSMDAHNKYVGNYIKQLEKENVKEKPEIFGTPADEYEKNKVAKHFKCSISPDNPNVDLKLLTKEFIKRLEYLTGYKLYYQGAIHKDTSHKHSHICINGKDKDGKEVYFPKGMIKTTMRDILSHVSTLMVGERTPQDIEHYKHKQIYSKRWTSIDDKLSELGNDISKKTLPLQWQQRLSFLESLNLANSENDIVSLNPEWKEVIIATGRYASFFEEYQNQNGKLSLYDGNGIKGKVVKVLTFDRTESSNDALIVEQGDNRVYVPIWQLHKKLTGKEIEINAKTDGIGRHVSDKDILITSSNNNRIGRK